MFNRFKTLENYSESDLENLRDATVAVVGLGATGSVIAENLARHGVKLILVDRDYLEPNDCYSSLIYTPEECKAAAPKAKAAEKYLEKFTDVEGHVESLDADNTELLSEADIIMDGTDNLETRFLIDEYCRKNGESWIYTAAIGEKGFSMLFRDKCFNCVFEEIRAGSLETCETAGIMRETSIIAASISTGKAVRYLTEKEVEEKLETVSGRSFKVEDSNCEVCREENFPHLESGSETVAVCGENKYQVRKDVSDTAFEKLRELSEDFTENEYLLRAELDGRSFVLFRDGRAIIEARDPGHAEAIYSEKIGV